MDFHMLSRRELQVLCKKNKIAANMTNVAMANALAALQHVEGLEEFLNPSEPTDAMRSPEKAPPETPAVSLTATRASARAKLTKDPDSSRVMSRARCSGMSSRDVADQENKQVNLPDTPAVPITGKRAGLASARRRQEAMKRDEKNEEENRDVPKSSTVKSTQRKARVSAAPRVYSTRRSVRLLEKSMSELKLSEERASEVEPIKMDDLGLKEESEEVLEEIDENKNTLDADSQAAVEESSEKPDHSNVPVEKSTGMEKERELESDVNVNVESSCIGDLGSKVLLEAACRKSDCLSAISDSDLKDDVLAEKSDQLDDNLLVSKLNQDAPPVDTSDLKDDILDEKSDQLDDNLLVSKLNQDASPVDMSVQTDGHNAFTEIEDHHVEETTNLEISEEVAFGEDNQSDDVDIDVEFKTEGRLLNENILDNEGEDNNEETVENGVTNLLIPEEQNSHQQMVENNEGVNQSDDVDVDVEFKTEEKLLNENILDNEEEGNNEGTVENGVTNPIIPEEQSSHQPKVENNEGVNISETINTSDDSDQLVPHIMTNSDRLVPHCDDIQEPVGNNDSGVEISMSSQLEIWDSTPVEQEESIKLDQLMSPCLVSPIIQTEKHEDEQLVEVDVIESEEYAMEVHEWHKSLVEASAAANSLGVNAPDIQEYADFQELVDIHEMPEMEFVKGTCELPPSANADKTPIFVSKISARSLLAVNGKVALSPLTADRLPKSPVLAKSSCKKQSTVRKTEDNKENMDSPPSPLAVAADQLLLELPGQVKSSSKKQPASRKITTLLGEDKENMQKSGRKIEPNTEKAKKKSDEEKSRDEDRVRESLKKKSLRQLKKMFKERSGMPETERKRDATVQHHLGSGRPALQVLSENQMALGEVEGN